MLDGFRPRSPRCGGILAQFDCQMIKPAPASRLSRLRTLALVGVLVASAACRQDSRAARQRFLDTGNRYMAAGEYAEAIIEYRNARALDPTSGEARMKLAEAFMQAGDFGSALQEFVRAADLLPDNLPLQLRAGNLLLLAGRFDDARARAEKVLVKNANDVGAQILVANALAGLKDLDAAVAQIEEALRIDPDGSRTYSSLGALELSRGRRDAAERAFKKAVQLQPDSVAARVALGTFYWLTNDFTAAEQSLTKALSLDRRSMLTNRSVASFYLATGRLDLAEQPLKTVFEVTKTPDAAFSLAEYYLAIGKDAAARTILQPMSTNPQTSASANVRLAALDYKGGGHGEAFRRLAAVLERDPANLPALLLKSSWLLSDGKLDEALASVSAAAERRPDSAPALFTLGRVQAARRQPGAAIAAYQEVLRLNPRAIEAKIALGRLQLAQGQPDASIELAEEALASEPKNADAQLLYVRGLLRVGELDRAQGELKQLIVRFPGSSAVHAQMGMLLGQRRDYAKARAEFERALQLRPDAVEALGGLIALDLNAHDYAAARARVDARIASNPTAALLTLAARIYAADRDLVSTERFLRKAIDLDGSYVAAYGALGQLYVVQGRLPEALAEFEALAARSPNSVTALTMAGIILQVQGKVDAARERFEQILRIDPEAAVAANNLAWMYAEGGGNLDVALHLAQIAQKRLADVAQVNDTLGFIYYKKNLLSLAISTLKMSAEKDPGNALYQSHLGLAYAKAGDDVRAKPLLTRALALKPDFDGAQEARVVLSSLKLHR
jgi:tetratricopeptide (TPR) repeat protein